MISPIINSKPNRKIAVIDQMMRQIFFSTDLQSCEPLLGGFREYDQCFEPDELDFWSLLQSEGHAW